MNIHRWLLCYILWMLQNYCTADPIDIWNRRKAYGNETQMLAKLLETYDVRLRPNFGAEPLYIGIETTLDSFLKVSEVNMDYTITLYLNQYWKDERLAFSTGNEMLTLSGEFAERIWVPDIYFVNDKQSFLHDVTEKNAMVRLHADGSVIYGMKFTTTLSCQMDLHYYPLDSQNCTVEIESYGYTVRDLLMYWRDENISLSKNLKPPQFKIIAVDTTDRTEELSTGSYQRLSLSFKLKRETSYFIFQTYLPSILIVMLSWIAFWINHEVTAARVTLGITTVLTMTTLSTAVRSSLPRISYVKAIDIYLVTCFIFVFAALLEYATVNNAFWEKKTVTPPKPKKSDTSKNPRIQIQDSSERLSSDSKKRALPSTSPVPEVDEMATHLSGRLTVKLRDGVKRLTVQEPTPQLRLSSTLGPKISRSSSFAGLTEASFQAQINRENLLHEPLFATPTPTSTLSRRSLNLRRKQLSKSLRRGVLAIENYIPDYRKDVNIIDKYSRVAFPLSFILFNIIYWGFYHDWSSLE